MGEGICRGADQEHKRCHKGWEEFVLCGLVRWVAQVGKSAQEYARSAMQVKNDALGGIAGQQG